MKSPTLVDPETIALKALEFLAVEPDRLEPFLAASGLSLANLRAAARDPGFLAGVLDHFVANESLLLSFAAEVGLDPTRIVQACVLLGGGPPGVGDEP